MKEMFVIKVTEYTTHIKTEQPLRVNKRHHL